MPERPPREPDQRFGLEEQLFRGLALSDVSPEGKVRKNSIDVPDPSFNRAGRSGEYNAREDCLRFRKGVTGIGVLTVKDIPPEVSVDVEEPKAGSAAPRKVKRTWVLYAYDQPEVGNESHCTVRMQEKGKSRDDYKRRKAHHLLREELKESLAGQIRIDRMP